MSTLREEIASAKSAPAFFSKNSKKDDSVDLRITSIGMRQTRDEKGKLETWEDGTPKRQVVITGDNLNHGVEGTKGNDQPAFTVYIKWWGAQRKNFAAACDAAEMDEPLVGDILSVTYLGEGEKPANKMLSAEKLYQFEMSKAPTR